MNPPRRNSPSCSANMGFLAPSHMLFYCKPLRDESGTREFSLVSTCEHLRPVAVQCHNLVLFNRTIDIYWPSQSY